MTMNTGQYKKNSSKNQKQVLSFDCKKLLKFCIYYYLLSTINKKQTETIRLYQSVN